MTLFMRWLKTRRDTAAVLKDFSKDISENNTEFKKYSLAPKGQGFYFF